MKMEEELDQIYKRLVGKRFQATYKGKFEVATGNRRDVLEIKDSDMEKGLAQILKEVRESDELKYSKVWKGITGPEDGYDNYRLFVDLDEDDLNEFVNYNFLVTEVTPFSNLDLKIRYQAGESISVRAE